MSVALGLDDAQRAIADAVAQFCRDHCSDEALRAASNGFPARLWHGLAELGVLGLATPEGGGGALEVVAAMEALGRAVFPGPLATTFFATRVVPETQRRAIAAGEAVASVGVPPLMPWAPVGQVFVVVENGCAWMGRPRGEVVPIATLGGEPWGRVELEREVDLGSARNALAVSDAALAAYLGAAGQRLVDAAGEHARTRKQFGRPIGEFQAVAHPLADCAIRLSAASTLARVAAHTLDEGREEAAAAAAAARLSAGRAALESAYVAHQVFGAVSVTLDGPVFHVARRVRQLVSQPPGESRLREGVLGWVGL